MKSEKFPSNFVWLGLAGVTAAGMLYFYSKQTTSPSTVVALNSKTFTDLKLESIKKVSPNASIFRFSLPSGNHVSGLNVASFVLVKNGDVIRPYTPISEPTTRGYLDLLVKKYEGGPMSTHIHSLNSGDSLSFKGPIKKIDYVPNKWEKVGMIAGGTGITPMLQIIHEALKDKTDKTKICLLFGNISEKDILLKGELDKLKKENPQRFDVVYYLNNPPNSSWKNTGPISKKAIEDSIDSSFFPKPNEQSSLVFACGSSGMLKHICIIIIIIN